MKSTQFLSRGLLFAAAVALSACSTSRTEMVNTVSMDEYDGESVVVMARSYHTGNATEKDFTDCVASQLRSGRNAINIMPKAQFVDAMYPWFEPRTVPNDISALPKLLNNPMIADRMRETGVRYVVWLDGNTDTPNGGGSVSCAAGPGGAGCFGFAWWESDSDYDAVVWDLEGTREAGNVETRVNGTSYLPAIIVPIPLIARTQSTACKDLSQQLQTFIASGA